MSHCGKKQLIHGSGIFRLSVGDLRNLVKWIYQKEGLVLPPISKSNRAQLCALLRKTKEGSRLIEISVSGVYNAQLPCNQLGGLKNFANSCYIDSTLVALLYKPNSYINEKILYANLSQLKVNPSVLKITSAIQSALINIRDTIKFGGKEHCVDLINLFD